MTVDLTTFGNATHTHKDLERLNYRDLTPEQCAEIDAVLDHWLALSGPDTYVQPLGEEEIASLTSARKKVRWAIETLVGHRLQVGFGILGGVAALAKQYVLGTHAYTPRELAGLLRLDEEDLQQAAPVGPYPRVGDLLVKLKQAGHERFGYPPPPPTTALFAPSHDAEFVTRLKQFRGHDNVFPNYKFKGGEGMIYLSDAVAGKCLKRWYASRVADFATSLRLLREAEQIATDDKLRQHVKVVHVYETGADWILRDFDLTTVPLNDVQGDETVATAVREAAARLEELGPVKSSSSAPSVGAGIDTREKMLKMLRRYSDNFHWSAVNKKIVILDMM
jgi:hypothetical protein